MPPARTATARLVLRAREALPALNYAALSSQPPSEADAEIIGKDVHRAGRQELGIANEDARPHREALRRVLHAWCALRPEIGYCQAMNQIAAALLVVVAVYIIGSSIADHETRLQTLVSLAFVLAAVAVHAAIEWWRHHRGPRLGSAKQRLADADSAASAVAPDHHIDHHHVH